MFEQVKQEIDDKIKTNGNNEITADRLNGVLQDMMDASAEVIEEVQQSIGDQVEANPTGEPTETLNKIKIGETNYNIPQTDTSNLVTEQELQQTLNSYVQKTDPPSPAVGDLVVFDEFGGFGTSEKTVNDFATAEQGAKADTALQPTGVKTINNQSIVGSGNITIEGGGTDDYADLDNKPQINSIALSGNKSASDLGLATAAQGAKADTAVQPSALNDYVQKSQTAGLLKNDGTVDTQTAGKAASALQPVQSATENNFASFDANGGIKDSGKNASDFATAVQGAKADTAVQQVMVGTTTTGNAGTNASVTNSGTSTAPVLDFTIPRGADAVSPFKGMFTSAAQLNSIYSNPSVGDYAYVINNTVPASANIYYCNNSQWVDSLIQVNITEIESSFPIAAKEALVNLLEHVAYTDEYGQNYLSALTNALFFTVVNISASFNAGTTKIYDNMTLDELREYITVTETLSGGTTITIQNYILSGTLQSGTSTLTVSANGKTTSLVINNVIHTELPSGYTPYDFIEYTGTDNSTLSITKVIYTKVYSDLNSVIIDFDATMREYLSIPTVFLGAQKPNAAYGPSNVITFLIDGSRQRVSVYSHGTALGINDIPNVSVGNVVHVNLNPQSSSPSILTADEYSDSQAWSDSNVINQAFGYCGRYANPNGTDTVIKRGTAIGVLIIKDLSNNILSKYYPCLRKNDNVIGIFDSVDNVFRTTTDLTAVTIGSETRLWNLINTEDL